MNDKINVLQVGVKTWETEYSFSDSVDWTFLDGTKEEIPKELENTSYDVVVLTGKVVKRLIPYLSKAGEPYSFFYTEECQRTPAVNNLIHRKMAKKIRNVQGFLNEMPYILFRGQEGYKISVSDLEFSAPWTRKIQYSGNQFVQLMIQEEEKFKPILFTKYNMHINLYSHRYLEIWPEYSLEDDIQIQYKIKMFRAGGSDIIWSKIYEGEDLKKPFLIKEHRAGHLTLQILAKGKGTLKIGPIHIRNARLGLGDLALGGKRTFDQTRGEVLSYFDPGDRKPPLTVYFSGYRIAEGFEGKSIIKSLGTPYLLIADPRLEGGAFYLGTQEYERKVRSIIQNALDLLHFTNHEMILSGLSMGTYGAMYYGSFFQPGAIVIGKPVLNLGTVADNERKKRMGSFPTSLDVLRMQTGGIGEEHVKQLNLRFWSVFDRADFRNTVFCVAYMLQDDYDTEAYTDLLVHLQGKEAAVAAKGLEGRHNDNTSGIVLWFMGQLRRILRQKYGREVE